MTEKGEGLPDKVALLRPQRWQGVGRGKRAPVLVGLHVREQEGRDRCGRVLGDAVEGIGSDGVDKLFAFGARKGDGRLIVARKPGHLKLVEIFHIDNVFLKAAEERRRQGIAVGCANVNNALEPR